jgi:NAD(P)-dependent dehydrogenase (short-subunit alcohol dehydrogenase family)
MAVASVRDLFDLSGKVAIVTGGARTLGFDMALAMAEMGANVAITSRKIEDAEKSVG